MFYSIPDTLLNHMIQLFQMPSPSSLLGSLLLVCAVLTITSRASSIMTDDVEPPQLLTRQLRVNFWGRVVRSHVLQLDFSIFRVSLTRYRSIEC